MKILIYIGLVLFLSFSNGQKENKHNETQQICWKGKLNSKTNILLHYQVQEDIIVGQITYLDTKGQIPIRIIGTIEKDKSYRLLEFEKTGNITGIITGLPKGNEFIGNWFSPKTGERLAMILRKFDKLVKLENIQTNLESIVGNYYYQYTKDGYQGQLIIKKVNQNKISFTIFSVTEDSGRNEADIPTDTVSAKTDFIYMYKFPEIDSCEFRVRFFKNFAYINYTKGYCERLFGHNATIDGIFYKQK